MEFTTEELQALRDETPGVRHRIHFNNAGSAPPPQSVLDAVVRHLELEARIGGYEARDAREEAAQEAYRVTAELLGVEPRQVAFVENASAGYAQALSSIPLERGDVILTSREDYVSNQIMFLALEKRLGVRLEHVASTPEGGLCLDDLRRRLASAPPRVFALTHVPTNSGLVQPVAEAGRLAREAGVWTMIDAVQSVGQRPVSLPEVSADFLTTTSRKFLRGPRGCGFLAVSDRVLAAGLEPFFLDMQGARWTGERAYEPSPSASRFENWEFAWALVLGAAEAVRYAQRIGIGRIARRTTGLAERLRVGLAGAGFRILDRGTDRCGIVTLEVRGVPAAGADAFLLRLNEAGLNGSISRLEYGWIDFTDKQVEWALRLSPHYYNTEEEVDRAVELVALESERSRS